MADPSPWLSIAIDAAVLVATAAIALVAHRFTKQQLAMQMVASLSECADAAHADFVGKFGPIDRLTSAEIPVVAADPALHRSAMKILNQAEIFCGCVVERTVDVAFTKRLAGPAILRLHYYFDAYMAHLIATRSLPGAWGAFQATARKWR